MFTEDNYIQVEGKTSEVKLPSSARITDSLSREFDETEAPHGFLQTRASCSVATEVGVSTNGLQKIAGVPQILPRETESKQKHNRDFCKPVLHVAAAQRLLRLKRNCKKCGAPSDNEVSHMFPAVSIPLHCNMFSVCFYVFPARLYTHLCLV